MPLRKQPTNTQAVSASLLAPQVSGRGFFGFGGGTPGIFGASASSDAGFFGISAMDLFLLKIQLAPHARENQ